MRRQRRTRTWLFAFALFGTACGADGGADPSTRDAAADASLTDLDATSSELADGSAEDVQRTSIDFEIDDSNAGTGTITFAEGGRISTTTAEGTVFQLDVPPFAVASDVTVTLTPLLNVIGVSEAGPVYGVALGPDGLILQQFARLTVTPAEALSASAQLAFRAASSGQNPGEALLDPMAAESVLLLEHFDVQGLAAVSASDRTTLDAIAADDPYARLTSAVGAFLNDAHRAHVLGSAAPSSDLADAYRAFEADSLAPLYDTTGSSCDASNTYLDVALSYARIRALAGDAPTDVLLNDLLAVVLTHQGECEAEALSLCRTGHDPAYLLEFRLRDARARRVLADAGLLDASSVPSDLPALATSATSDCAVQGFRASGGSAGLVVSGELDDPAYPFALQGDLDGTSIVLSFSPGPGNTNAGSYQYSAKTGASGHGTYTLSAHTDGSITLVADGERCASDTCSASEDTILLSPRT